MMIVYLKHNGLFLPFQDISQAHFERIVYTSDCYCTVAMQKRCSDSQGAVQWQIVQSGPNVIKDFLSVIYEFS